MGAAKDGNDKTSERKARLAEALRRNLRRRKDRERARGDAGGGKTGKTVDLEPSD